MGDIIREHARLHLLNALAEQPDHRLNSLMLRDDIADRWAINRPLDWVHGEMNWLADMGAVTLHKIDDFLIATITARGLDHVESRRLIEGVKRPGPKG